MLRQGSRQNVKIICGKSLLCVRINACNLIRGKYICETAFTFFFSLSLFANSQKRTCQKVADCESNEMASARRTINRVMKFFNCSVLLHRYEVVVVSRKRRINYFKTYVSTVSTRRERGVLSFSM